MGLGNGVEFGQEWEKSIKMSCKDNEEEEKEEIREKRHGGGREARERDAEDTFYCVAADYYNVKLGNDT